jgi:hypothetical protein
MGSPSSFLIPHAPYSTFACTRGRTSTSECPGTLCSFKIRAMVSFKHFSSIGDSSNSRAGAVIARGTWVATARLRACPKRRAAGALAQHFIMFVNGQSASQGQALIFEFLIVARYIILPVIDRVSMHDCSTGAVGARLRSEFESSWRSYVVQ